MLGPEMATLNFRGMISEGIQNAMHWVLGIGIFLFLLFTFPRAMGALLALSALAIGGFFLWIKIQSDEREKRSDEREKRRASVAVIVDYDLDRCSSDYPLFVGVVNRSDSTIEKLSFGIEGHRTGYSDPLYSSGYLGYTTDRIIASGDGWGSCWTLPKEASQAARRTLDLNPPENLIWSIQHISPTFRDP